MMNHRRRILIADGSEEFVQKLKDAVEQVEDWEVVEWRQTVWRPWNC